MKKIFFAIGLILVLSTGLRISAQQPVRIRYYYYPASNIYYNPVAKEYWYYDEGTTTWMEVQALPTTITLRKAPRYTIYYIGEDVWKENAMHKKKYKVKSNPVAKTKAKPKKT